MRNSSHYPSMDPAMNMAELSIEKERLQDILNFLRKSHRYYRDVMVPNLAAGLERLVEPTEKIQEYIRAYNERLGLNPEG